MLGDAARPRSHHDDPVGQEDRFADVVRDEDDRLPRLLPESQEQQVHLVARERVERAEGLVHQEHGGVLRERAHDRGPLLHAARELARVGLVEADEAGLVEERSRSAPRPGFAA